ncbi:MAG TPA: hypothetical protein VHX86_09270 [Tepidisphaeraceae bacterium]|jgi:ammonia channel protein AmtB|nr:hypothetical protein [Tepidisphaeraceae bacterium]
MNRASLARCGALVTFFGLGVSTANAAEPVRILDPSHISSGDTAWMLTSTALVLMMTGPGLALFAATRLKHALGYDDSLDAFGVHGVGGTIGAILTGVFAVAAVNLPAGFGNITKLGLIEGNTTTAVHQLIATGVAWTIAAVGSLILLLIVNSIIGLRVTEEDEYEGLDLSQHGESGYNIEDAFSATYAGGGATLIESGEPSAMAAAAQH